MKQADRSIFSEIHLNREENHDGHLEESTRIAIKTFKVTVDGEIARVEEEAGNIMQPASQSAKL
jgi:hypothetical protein